MQLNGQDWQVIWFHTSISLITCRLHDNIDLNILLLFCWQASPLISFQSPSLEFRLTLRAMAVKDPVWRDCTSVLVLTPAAKPTATFPGVPLLPRYMEQPPLWLDVQSATDLWNVSPRGAILKWPRREVGGFFTNWWLPGDKMCLNLAPAPWNLAVTQGRGLVQRGNLYAKSADICSFMPNYHQKYSGRVAKTKNAQRRSTVGFNLDFEAAHCCCDSTALAS